MAIDEISNKTKTILITGSTDGVGRVVAENLASKGHTILIHGRDKQRAEDVSNKINQAGGKARYYLADFSSINEVRHLAVMVQNDYPALDILINNAGIGVSGAHPTREQSHDGLELRFAVNYMAGFVLTRLLLPQLKKSSSARIVNVSSAGQQSIDFLDVMLEKNYSGMRAYCQSKLAQIIFTLDIAKELSPNNITVNALHPASYMDTSMVRGDSIQPMSSVEEGANAICHLVEDLSLEGQSGKYFNGKNPTHAMEQAYDENAQKLLRELSFKLSGLKSN